MTENIEYVQRGFRILVSATSGYLGQQLSRKYRDNWWEEVLHSLNDQYDLPFKGSYGDLVDSLDIANCLRLIDRRWREDFRDTLTPSCRAWARELMGVRNIVAHSGQQDMDQHVAERALDTMALLCAEMDPESADEIRDLWQEVRGLIGNTTPSVRVEYASLEQPESESVRGALGEGSLLLVGSPLVEKTAMSRKVSFSGRTTLYPVYRVRLDALYYNDQNDRIATWITRYEAENGAGSLKGLDPAIYNSVIENFIVDSNPDAIRRTQKNISMIGQREPGVTLADGRIVDGNRRFTCLRRLQRLTAEPLYFETVLMDMDIRADRKQIKLLELAVQHGEEKKVDYDQIDYAIGTWRDITETGLLTVDEYAAGANESPAEVRRRLQIAEIICEFLSSFGLEGQYHVAREYQVYSLFEEMLTPLRQLDPEDQKQLKTIAFNNAVTGAIADQRKFIRDIKTLVRTGNYFDYFLEQSELDTRLKELLDGYEIHGKADLDRFTVENSVLADELRDCMEKALLRSRSSQLKNKPAENVGKCISQLRDIDSRLIERLDPEDKETLKASLDELALIIDDLRSII